MGKLLVKVIRRDSWENADVESLSLRADILKLTDIANGEMRASFPNAIPKTFKYVDQKYDPDTHAFTVTIDVIDKSQFHQIDSVLTDAWVRALGGQGSITTPTTVGQRKWWEFWK